MRKTLLATVLTVGGLLCLESSAKAQVYISGGHGGYYSPYVAPVYSRPVFVPTYTPYYGGYYGGYRNYSYPSYRYGGYGSGINFSNFGRRSGYSFSIGRGGIGFSSYNFGRGRRW